MVFSEMDVEELEHECDYLSFMYDQFVSINKYLCDAFKKEYKEKWGIIQEGY